MFKKKKDSLDELMEKYGIPRKIKTDSTTVQSGIHNFDVIRQDGPNKRVSVYRDADGEIMAILERDLFLDIF